MRTSGLAFFIAFLCTLHLHAQNKIRVGGDSNYPPYEFLNEKGQPDGFNVELTKAIAEAMNFKIEIQLDTWNTVRNRLEMGELDIVQGMFYSKERDSLYDMSPPHSFISHVLVGRAGEQMSTNWKDLASHTLLVMEGDIMHDFAVREGLEGNLILVKDQQEALKLLSQGFGNAALLARIPALFWINKNGAEKLKVFEKTFVVSPYCYGVLEGENTLLQSFNDGLTILKTNGKYREIYDKWLGVYEEDSQPLKKIIRISLLLIGILLVLLILAIIWSRTLNNRVITRTAALQKEIQERKKVESHLRESEERFRQLAENTEQVFWLTDWNEMKLLYVSPSYEKIFGGPTDEAYADRLSWKKYIIPEDYNYVDKTFTDSRKQSSYTQAEYRIRTKSGEIKWLHDRSFPVRNSAGKVYRFVSIAEDITSRKLFEEQLIIAKQKAEESDRLKSAFLANMSHEIRTPMNGILGFAELLEDPHLDGEEQKRYVEVIQKSGTRMLNIINDLINISKIEAGQIQVFMVSTDISALCQDLHSFFLPEARKKGLVLEFMNEEETESLTIQTDKQKLHQVLQNLIKNALKFTNSGSIRFGYSANTKEVRFFVSDTGSGISKESIEGIFERFRQGDAADRRDQEGAGLGLSISKAFVELLGGQIWVDSIPGKGSEFYFTLAR